MQAGWVPSAATTPSVVTPWGNDLLTHPYRSQAGIRSSANYVLKRADRITADSQALRLKAIHFGGAPEVTDLIQFGVDSGCSIQSLGTSNLRDQIGAASSPIVLSSRAIAPIYNIDIIIDAIPAILSKHPNTLFIFKDYNVDPAYKARLDAQSRRLG